MIEKSDNEIINNERDFFDKWQEEEDKKNTIENCGNLAALTKRIEETGEKSKKAASLLEKIEELNKQHEEGDNSVDYVTNLSKYKEAFKSLFADDGKEDTKEETKNEKTESEDITSNDEIEDEEEKQWIPKTRAEIAEEDLKEMRKNKEEEEQWKPETRAEIAERELKEMEKGAEEEARIKNATNNLKALFENKNRMSGLMEKQEKLAYKLKAWFGSEKTKPVTSTEYDLVSKEYEESLKEVQELTGKSREDVLREYLSTEEKGDESIERVNSILDEADEKLEKEEGEQSQEKKSLYEKINALSDNRKVKIAIAVVIVGGAIATGVGAGIGLATGMGFLQYFGLQSIVTYPSVASWASAQAFNVALAGVGGGSVLARLWNSLKKENTVAEKSENKKQEQVINRVIRPIKPTVDKITTNEIDGVEFVPAAVENASDKEEPTTFETDETRIDYFPQAVENASDKEEPTTFEIKGVFEEVESFDELYRKMDEVKSIKDSHGTDISSEEMKRMIEEVRKGDLDLQAITRTGGLRDKVKELKEMEEPLTVEMNASFKESKDFKELYERLEKIGPMAGSDGKVFNFKQVREVIEKLRYDGNNRDYKMLPDIGDLRGKVKELIEKK